MLIAVEGMDASGKATHTKLLAEKLGGVVIDFPHYSTPVGHLIKSHLLSEWKATPRQEMNFGWRQDNQHLDPMVFQCLQTINRLEKLGDIYAAIHSGKTVVFDRYWASAVVYGGLDGLDVEWIKKIQAPLPEPDLWLFLDIPPEESLRRRPERRDRYEKQPGLMERVRDSYRKLFIENGAEDGSVRSLRKSKWHIIDGMGTKEEVHARIMAVVEKETGWTPPPSQAA